MSRHVRAAETKPVSPTLKSCSNTSLVWIYYSLGFVQHGAASRELSAIQPWDSKSINMVLVGQRQICCTGSPESSTSFSCLLWCSKGPQLWMREAPAQCKTRRWWLTVEWENVTDYIRAPAAVMDMQDINHWGSLRSEPNTGLYWTSQSLPNAFSFCLTKCSLIGLWGAANCMCVCIIGDPQAPRLSTLSQLCKQHPYSINRGRICWHGGD